MHIAIGAVVTALTVAAVSAGAVAKSPKPRAPRIAHLKGSVSSRRASVSVEINPSNLQSSYQVELVYRPATGCCIPGTKECCAPTAVETILAGNLPAGSTYRQIHASGQLKEGSWAVRARVQATNSVGSNEKSHKLAIPRG